MKLYMPKALPIPNWLVDIVNAHDRDYPEEDVKNFVMANEYSYENQKEHIRASRESQYVHCCRGVARMLVAGYDLIYIIVYYLHEFEEDCGWSEEDIASIFGPRVARLVTFVSKRPKELFTCRKDRVEDRIEILNAGVEYDWGVPCILNIDRGDNTQDTLYLTPKARERLFFETELCYIPYLERSKFYIPKPFRISYEQQLLEIKLACGNYINAVIRAQQEQLG